jgi:hypothetical protein
VFENKVLRRIFGPKRDEVTEKWRKLHNEELRDLYDGLLYGASSTNGGEEERVEVIDRKEIRKRHRWVDNVEMDLGETGWGGVDWIGLAQDRDKWRALVKAVLSLRVP